MSLGIFQVDSDDCQPKYRQIIQNVIGALQAGKLERGDMLPSINELSSHYDVSRDTVVKAYKHLREIAVLLTIPGKGFFIQADHYSEACRVFLLFDEIENPYKHRMLEGIKEGVGSKADLYPYFHHYDPEVFVNLVEDARRRFEYFVVMAFDHPIIKQVMNTFDQSQLLVLDQDCDFDGKDCSVIRQDFDKRLEYALGDAVDLLAKYNSFNLVFPEEENHPQEIKRGFRRFCRRNGFRYSVKSQLSTNKVQRGEAWFVINDDHLVELVKLCRQNRWNSGKDLGILSYNDIPFKEVVDQGISVVSVDFHDMGSRVAHEILSRDHIDQTCPTQFIARKSL